MSSDLRRVDITAITDISQPQRSNCQKKYLTSLRNGLKHLRYCRHLHNRALLPCGGGGFVRYGALNGLLLRLTARPSPIIRSHQHIRGKEHDNECR
jgi:hypothetical protein